MDKFDHVKWSTTSDDQSGSSQTRSYTCTFCKRGFSNAQALGGHMNIHRRDRARIRQFSEENQLSNSDTLKTTPIDPTNFALEENTSSLQLELLSEQNSGITKNSYNSFNSREDEQAIHRGKVAVDHHQEIQKLPLFVEEPTTNDNNYKCEEKRPEKLDLELRLGPDPADHHKSRFSTQEFF